MHQPRSCEVAKPQLTSLQSKISSTSQPIDTTPFQMLQQTSTASQAVIETASSDKPPERTACDWREVPRQMPVYILGDSYGSYEGFIAHHQLLNLVRFGDKEKLWTGGAAHLVHLGDILADRNVGSFQIIEDIANSPYLA